MARFVVLLLFATVVLAGAASPRAAHACSGEISPYPDWLGGAVNEDIVFIADVVAETNAAEVGPDYFRDNPHGPDSFVIPSDRNLLRISTLAPVVVLKGAPTPRLDLWPLDIGIAPSCEGGPRLPAGRRVLAFLSWDGDRARWTGEGTHFELGGQTATVRSVLAVDGMVVDTTELITEIARLTGADDATRDAALAAALQPPTLPSTGSADWAAPTGAPALVLIAGLAAAVAAGCAALGRAARRR